MQRATAGMAPPPAPQPRFASDYVYHFAEAEPLPLINTGIQAGAHWRSNAQAVSTASHRRTILSLFFTPSGRIVV